MKSSKALVLVSVLLMLGVSYWGWSVDPDPPLRWFILAGVLPFLWGCVERAQGGTRDPEREAILRWHRRVLAYGGLMIAFAVATELLIATGIVDAAGALAVRRSRGIFFGVSMMLWGNYLPKLASPWSLEEQPFEWQKVHRFVGWGASLGGLAMALAWLLLPLEDARSLSIVILGLAAALALGKKLLSLAAKARRSTPASGV